MARKTIVVAKRAAARTKKALAATEVNTDNFLLRLAASPYSGAILAAAAFIAIVAIYMIL